MEALQDLNASGSRRENEAVELVVLLAQIPGGIWGLVCSEDGAGGRVELQVGILGDGAVLVDYQVAVFDGRKVAEQVASGVFRLLRCFVVYSVPELDVILEPEFFEQPGGADAARGLEEVEGNIRHFYAERRQQDVRKCRKRSEKVRMVSFLMKIAFGRGFKREYRNASDVMQEGSGPALRKECGVTCASADGPRIARASPHPATWRDLRQWPVGGMDNVDFALSGHLKISGDGQI